MDGTWGKKGTNPERLRLVELSCPIFKVRKAMRIRNQKMLWFWGVMFLNFAL